MDLNDDEVSTNEAVPNRTEKTTLLGAQPSIGENVGDWFIERAKYTPVRLTMEERKFLRLLEAALGISQLVICEMFVDEQIHRGLGLYG
jgi:hypothetical protein